MSAGAHRIVRGRSAYHRPPSHRTSRSPHRTLQQRLCVGIFRFPDRHRIAVIILPECQILLVPVRRHRIQCKSRDQRVKGFDAALLFRLNPVTHPRVAIPRCIPILAVDLCQPIKVLCAVLLCHSQQVAAGSPPRVTASAVKFTLPPRRTISHGESSDWNLVPP